MDVQKDTFWYVIRGWSKTLESWLIVEGFAMSWEEIDSRIYTSEFETANREEKMRVRLACFDSGYRTDEVYDYVRKNPFARATKGASSKTRAPYTATRIDSMPDGSRLKEGLMLWMIDTEYWKDFVYRRMQAGLWHVYQGVSEEYISQVTSEQKIPKRNRQTGKVIERWETKREGLANHLWDCEVLAAVAADMLGVQFWEEEQPPSRNDEKDEEHTENSWIHGGRRKGKWL